MEKQIKENSDLLKSLVKAQEKLLPMKMDMDNSFFKSKYLGLAVILREVKPVLASEGVVFIQGSDLKDDSLIVTTELAHQNGEEYIQCSMELPVQSLKAGSNFMQAVGSAITYMRRYQATAILGLVGDEDDDGNKLEGTEAPPKKKAPPKPPVKAEPAPPRAPESTPPKRQEPKNDLSIADFIPLINALPNGERQGWMKRATGSLNDKAELKVVFTELRAHLDGDKLELTGESND